MLLVRADEMIGRWLDGSRFLSVVPRHPFLNDIYLTIGRLPMRKRAGLNGGTLGHRLFAKSGQKYPPTEAPMLAKFRDTFRASAS